MLSALADEEFGVGVREVLDEELRVGPAFGCADFDNPFHDRSPVDGMPTDLFIGLAHILQDRFQEGDEATQILESRQ